MAVYERSYKRYTGALSADWSRFLVMPRYIFADLMKKRFFLIFLVLCFFWPVLSGVFIYITHNARLLETFNIQVSDLLKIDATFFRVFLYAQGPLAFFLMVFVGPGLITRDLVNNSLPLYLARPISRGQYLLGKFSVLAILGSAVTWVPGLLLYVIQGNLAGEGWLFSHLRIAFALFAGSWLWITVVALLALALSAWVRWRSVAAFLMLVAYFGGGFVRVLFLVFFDTEWGQLADLGASVRRIWTGLLGLELAAGPPLWAGWLTLGLLAAFCLLLLHRKVRAYEVVS